MECIDPLMAFAAKEEILRIIVQTHAVIMIEGGTGTGKTVTTLKAVKGRGQVYYYSEPTETTENLLKCIGEYGNKLTIVKNAAEVQDLQAGQQCIVFDGIDHFSSEGRSMLEAMIRKRANDMKILVITRAASKAQDFQQDMEAVVRFKLETAEILHSKFIDFEG